MATKKKMLQAAAGVGGEALDITDVFSTYLYEDNYSTQTITNGIDLSGEGGLVWIKDRSGAYSHSLTDTERGAGKFVRSDSTAAQITKSDTITSFNSDGFSLGNDSGNYGFAYNGSDYASWTFRKAPKFFDVVTYTGDGVTGRSVSHNLGSVPGVIIVKNISTGNRAWQVYHRSLGITKRLELDSTGVAGTSTHWTYEPTDTEFTVRNLGVLNASGDTYVAYLFAHNDGDGEFGPDADQDIIKCGSYTGTGSTNGPEIDLGFEPQWVMVKRADSGAEHWAIIDNMRQMISLESNNARMLKPNNNEAEEAVGFANPLPTGFKVNRNEGVTNASGGNYIYIAIRRGPLAPPKSATEVFDVSTRNASEPAYTSGFPVDFAFARAKSIANNWDTGSRLQQGNRMFTNLTNAEASNSNMMFDYQEGWSAGTGASTDYLSYTWRRAPGFFDVVAYTGNSTIRTISHNLGVAPEMMWLKSRSNSKDWTVYHKDLGAVKRLRLNNTTEATNEATAFNSTAPTSSVFTVGTSDNTNENPQSHIAYLFASLDGISKVGSYTGNGTSQTIDCGFTSGARFVMIKRTTGVGNWNVWDTERGIVAGNDPRLELNSTLSEHNPQDYIDPDTSGFVVNYVADNGDDTNVNGVTFIFYAIA
jgi:hypothetical protein